MVSIASGRAQGNFGFNNPIGRPAASMQARTRASDPSSSAAAPSLAALASESPEQRRTRLVKDMAQAQSGIAGLENALARLAPGSSSSAARLLARPDGSPGLRQKMKSVMTRCASAAVSGQDNASRRQQSMASLRQEASALHADLTLAYDAAKAFQTTSPEAYRSALEEVHQHGSRSAEVLANAATRLGQAQARDASASEKERAHTRHAAVFAVHAKLVLPSALQRVEQTLSRLDALEAREQRAFMPPPGGGHEMDQLRNTRGGAGSAPGQKVQSDAARSSERGASSQQTAWNPTALARDAERLVWARQRQADKKNPLRRVANALTMNSNQRVLGVVHNLDRINGPVSTKSTVWPFTQTRTQVLHPDSDERKFDDIRTTKIAMLPLRPARVAFSQIQQDLQQVVAGIEQDLNRAGRSAALQRQSGIRKPIGLNALPKTERDAIALAQRDTTNAGLIELNHLTAIQKRASDAHAQLKNLYQNSSAARRAAVGPDLDAAAAALARANLAVTNKRTQFRRDLQEATFNKIDRLDGFASTPAGAPERLRQTLKNLYAEAAARPACQKTDSTLPAHEIDCILAALHTSVPLQNGKACPQRALAVLNGMRDKSISTLMAELAGPAPADPGAAALRRDTSRLMSELAQLPRGVDAMQGMTAVDPGPAGLGSAAKKVLAATRIEALQTHLRAEAAKTSLASGTVEPDPRLMRDLALAQHAAVKRYGKPKAELTADEQRHYGALRNGLVGNDGGLEKMNESAAVLSSYHERLQRQSEAARQVGGFDAVGLLRGQRESRAARPGSAARAEAREAERASRPHHTMRELLTDYGRCRRERNEHKARFRHVDIAHYAPVSVMNPASLNAFNKTSTSYSADISAKTAARVDGHLLKLSDKIRQATLDHIAAHKGEQPSAAERQRYLELLAPLATASVAKEVIRQAKAPADGSARKHIRPEHLELRRAQEDDDTTLAPDQHPTVAAVRNALAELCQLAGLSDTPDAAPGERLEEQVARISRASVGDADGFPLTRAHLFQQVSRLEQAEALAVAAPGTPASGEARPGDTEVDAAARQQSAESLRQAVAARTVIEGIMPAMPIEVADYASVRAMLHTFVQQAEFHNKFRLTSIEANEGKLRPFGANFTEALHATEEVGDAAHAHLPAGVGFKVRGEISQGRSEFFEVSYSTAGFEITIGEEQRGTLAGGAGVNFSGGYADGAFSAKGTLGGEAAVVRDVVRHSGVKFIIPRSTSKEYSDEKVRDGENKDLIDSLFPPGGTDAIAAVTAGSAAGHIQSILETCPHVSVNLIGDSYDDTLRFEKGLSAGFVGKAAVVGATLSVGGQFNSFDRDVGVSERSGALNIERVNQAKGSNRNTVNAASIGLSIPFARPKGTFGVGNVGARVKTSQVNGSGNDVKFRLIKENGRTYAVNSRSEIEFTRARDIIAHIDKNEAEIIQLALEQKFPPGYGGLNDAERRQLAKEDLDQLRKKISACESDGKNLTLRNVFGVSSCMTEAAALQNDVLMGQRIVLEKKLAALGPDKAGDIGAAPRAAVAEGVAPASAASARDQLVEQLRQNWKAQDELLDVSSSWRIWKITGCERTFFQEQLAADYIYKHSIQTGADAQRDLFSYPS